MKFKETIILQVSLSDTPFICLPYPHTYYRKLTLQSPPALPTCQIFFRQRFCKVLTQFNLAKALKAFLQSASVVRVLIKCLISQVFNCDKFLLQN